MITLAIVCLGTGRVEARADGPTTIDQVLGRWEAEAAGWRTVDVRFTFDEGSTVLTDGKRLEGRLLLKNAEEAEVELRKPGEDAASAMRIIWSPTEVRQYIGDGIEGLSYPKPRRRGTGLSDPITLPFLYGRRVDEVREHYEVRLERETDASYLIRFSPRNWAGRDPGLVDRPKGNVFQRMFTRVIYSQFAFSRAYLELDKKTLLPRTFILIDRVTTTIRATETRVNDPAPVEPPKAQP